MVYKKQTWQSTLSDWWVAQLRKQWWYKPKFAISREWLKLRPTLISSWSGSVETRRRHPHRLERLLTIRSICSLQSYSTSYPFSSDQAVKKMVPITQCIKKSKVHLIAIIHVASTDSKIIKMLWYDRWHMFGFIIILRCTNFEMPT